MKFVLSLLVFVSVQVAAGPLQPIQEVIEPKNPGGNTAMVAVLQWVSPSPAPLGVSKAEAEAFKQGNRETVATYIRQAAAHGAKMVITSEFGIVGYPHIPGVPPEEMNFRNRADIEPYLETSNGPTAKYFGKLAKELGVYIHVGFAEVDTKTDKYYNTVVALDPNGKVATTFRKINLFSHEGDFLSAGTDIATYDSIFGTVGIIICADVYSSNPMEDYKGQVDVLALSTSWAQMNTGWSNFTRGAKWVGAPLLAANQHYFPDSGVINADGSTQSHIRQTNGLAYGYLPLK